MIGAAIDPTSRFLATGGRGENSLRVWDLLTGRLVGHRAYRIESGVVGRVP